MPGIQPQTAGLEVLGQGKLAVNGAILVNNTWKGIDENGEPAGKSMLLKSACACTPLLQTSSVRARNIRVVVGSGTFESAMAVGSLRAVLTGDISVNPTSKFPPAQEVYLVE